MGQPDEARRPGRERRSASPTRRGRRRVRRRRARRSSRRGTRSAGRDRRRPATGCPGTSANSVIAGTIRRPSRSRPTTAGGPPPEANTRSNSRSPRRAARAEVLDDPDHAAPDRDVAHELRRPRVDLLVALVREPGCGIPSGRPTGRRRHVISWPDRAEYARDAGVRSEPRSPARRAAAPPSGQSLKTSVTHRPTGPGGGKSGRSATSAWSAVQRRAVSSSTASRRGRPATSIGSPTTTRTRRPSLSQLVPLIAIGTSGTPERSAKYAGPSSRRQQVVLRGVDPALARDREHAAGSRGPR